VLVAQFIFAVTIVRLKYFKTFKFDMHFTNKSKLIFLIKEAVVDEPHLSCTDTVYMPAESPEIVEPVE
jgi:hypothetical protein